MASVGGDPGRFARENIEALANVDRTDALDIVGRRIVVRTGAGSPAGGREEDLERIRDTVRESLESLGASQEGVAELSELRDRIEPKLDELGLRSFFSQILSGEGSPRDISESARWIEKIKGNESLLRAAEILGDIPDMEIADVFSEIAPLLSRIKRQLLRDHKDPRVQKLIASFMVALLPLSPEERMNVLSQFEKSFSKRLGGEKALTEIEEDNEVVIPALLETLNEQLIKHYEAAPLIANLLKIMDPQDENIRNSSNLYHLLMIYKDPLPGTPSLEEIAMKLTPEDLNSTLTLLHIFPAENFKQVFKALTQKLCSIPASGQPVNNLIALIYCLPLDIFEAHYQPTSTPPEDYKAEIATLMENSEIKPRITEHLLNLLQKQNRWDPSSPRENVQYQWTLHMARSIAVMVVSRRELFGIPAQNVLSADIPQALIDHPSPLLQEAAYLFVQRYSDLTEYTNDPYFRHCLLHKYRSMPLGSIREEMDVEGKHVAINLEGLKAKALDRLSHKITYEVLGPDRDTIAMNIAELQGKIEATLDQAVNRMRERCGELDPDWATLTPEEQTELAKQRIADQISPDTNFDLHIRKNLLEGALRDILSHVRNPDEAMPSAQAQLIAIFRYCMSLSDVPGEGYELSERERILFNISSHIHSCRTGKEQQIAQIYSIHIPKDFRWTSALSDTSPRGEVERFFVDMLQEITTRFLRGSDPLYLRLTGRRLDQIGQSVHEVRLVENLIGHWLGYAHEIVFDPFIGICSRALLDDSPETMLREALKVFNPEFLVNEYKRRLAEGFRQAAEGYGGRFIGESDEAYAARLENVQKYADRINALLPADSPVSYDIADPTITRNEILIRSLAELALPSFSVTFPEVFSKVVEKIVALLPNPTFGDSISEINVEEIIGELKNGFIEAIKRQTEGNEAGFMLLPHCLLVLQEDCFDQASFDIVEIMHNWEAAIRGANFNSIVTSFCDSLAVAYQADSFENAERSLLKSLLEKALGASPETTALLDAIMPEGAPVKITPEQVKDLLRAHLSPDGEPSMEVDIKIHQLSKLIYPEYAMVSKSAVRDILLSGKFLRELSEEELLSPPFASNLSSVHSSEASSVVSEEDGFEDIVFPGDNEIQGEDGFGNIFIPGIDDVGDNAIDDWEDDNLEDINEEA